MENDINQYVINNVRRIRQERGISQAALADYINVSRGFIGDIENPKHRAKYNISLLNEVAKALDCSIRDFFPEKYL